MSQSELKEEIKIEESEQIDGGKAKLVPVSEAIHYRRRAQGAEQKAESLAIELEESKAKAAEATKELESMRSERSLKDALAASGCVDVETALLVAKAKLEGQDQADLDVVIEQLKKEKRYLFAESEKVKPTKTASVKERASGGEAVLERAARKAATSGNRGDLQEYLRLRRNFV
ncbi:MAG: hypothetical protein ACYTFM_08165 [Planctomycetota bacterium]|jgi:hypothetical protein